ncbi:lactate utilization protein C [Nocardioides gansuensis]|uniref:Lactate utilization protein C n=1 Tax=Nocardioides gansuensis TaxID=2138300 RepID=A0A2T8F8C7_9ACTN|nr:LUD domain-containing protein [Nocardioides gansuensis]PVG81950.1 lactate utilization protein C [Nocardioides gansuensis]
MSARDEILGRVRSALTQADRSPVAVPTTHRGRVHEGDLVELFVERVEDYRATVTRCADSEVAGTVSRLLPEGTSVVLAPGFEWSVPGAAVDSGLTAVQLDSVGAVVTGATVGIAETGTLVLTHGPGEGRRLLSLVPDVHVCVVRASQVVADVPAAIGVLDPRRPQTWISGPSATSDIELDRVEGVHGPRTLHVVIVD